jgi:hypothetical protein
MVAHEARKNILKMPAQTADDRNVPVISVSDDVYNAILLAEGALIVAEGQESPKMPLESGLKLPNFFAVRQYLLTAGHNGVSLSGISKAGTAMLKCMVGG